jgi:hypothetical protein
MSAKPAKVRTHFYTVALKTGRSTKKDFTAATEAMMASIEELARATDIAAHVTLKTDGEALTKLGIFFMNAPERFAEDVKNIDGIKSVEKPATKKKASGTQPRRRPSSR